MNMEYLFIDSYGKFSIVDNGESKVTTLPSYSCIKAIWLITYPMQKIDEYGVIQNGKGEKKD